LNAPGILPSDKNFGYIGSRTSPLFLIGVISLGLDSKPSVGSENTLFFEVDFTHNRVLKSPYRTGQIEAVMNTKRISHSLLDPYLTSPLKGLYGRLPIPRRFPPEGIVLVGHLCAIAAAIGCAFSTRFWWGGVLLAVGVAANHIADVLDGTHARSTGQCRNGGELLDHFVDPLSFSYWIVGLSFSCGRLDWGLAAVICLYATAVLTNIKAKMIGEFTLARFGPTEFKTLLVVYGLGLAALSQAPTAIVTPLLVAQVFFGGLVVVGMVQLVVNLVSAVRDVNANGAPPDQTEWVITESTTDSDDSISHDDINESSTETSDVMCATARCSREFL
jgi:phosphatidylglycerophosphate synthase